MSENLAEHNYNIMNRVIWKEYSFMIALQIWYEVSLYNIINPFLMKANLFFIYSSFFKTIFNPINEIHIIGRAIRIVFALSRKLAESPSR